MRRFLVYVRQRINDILYIPYFVIKIDQRSEDRREFQISWSIERIMNIFNEKHTKHKYNDDNKNSNNLYEMKESGWITLCNR